MKRTSSLALAVAAVSAVGAFATTNRHRHNVFNQKRRANDDVERMNNAEAKRDRRNAKRAADAAKLAARK